MKCSCCQTSRVTQPVQRRRLTNLDIVDFRFQIVPRHGHASFVGGVRFGLPVTIRLTLSVPLGGRISCSDIGLPVFPRIGF